jgi:TIR domain
VARGDEGEPTGLSGPGQASAGHAFISYVRENSRRIDYLQRELEAAGIPVWRDTADLWPGEDWREKIREAITDNALVFIACFSEASLRRHKSYQNEELVLAIEQLRLRRPDNPWLIPVRLDECHIPDRDIGGGRTLTSIQRVDLFGEHAAEGVKRLVATVTRILTQAPADTSQYRPEPPNIDRRQAAASSAEATGPSPPDRRAGTSPSAVYGMPGYFVRSRTALVGGAISAAAVGTVILIAFLTGLWELPSSPGRSSNSPNSVGPGPCPTSAPAYYQAPKVLPAARGTGIAVCPVDINGGQAINRIVSLSGRVIGKPPAGQHLALVARSDPTTCDLDGNPGTGGYDEYEEVNPSGRSGAWQASHTIYPRSATIRRVVFFVLGPESTLRHLLAEKAEWQKTHKTTGYPGRQRLPSDLKKLAYVTVQGQIPRGHHC